MTLPEQPLRLDDFDPGRLTLGDLALLTPRGTVDFEWAVEFGGFLARHTSWSQAEIARIELSELKTVADQLTEAIQSLAVPLAKSPRSKTGRGRKRKGSPAGSTTSSTEKSSTSSPKT